MANNTRHIVGGGLGTLRKLDADAWRAREDERQRQFNEAQRAANINRMHAVARATTKEIGALDIVI